MLGYENRKYSYSVMPYDAEWRRVYEREATLLKNVLRSDLLYIEHVGGTAVPGLVGRPTIDIVVFMKDLQKCGSYDLPLRALGYEAAPSEAPGKTCFFKKDAVSGRGGWMRAVNLYISPDEHPGAMAMIEVRDYLVAHPDEARKFGECKEKLWKKHPGDYSEYHEDKEKFLEELTERAAKWRGHRVEAEKEWGDV